MIAIEWRDGSVIFSEEGLSALPESSEKRVASVLSKPALVQRSSAIPADEGAGIVEELVSVAPGEPGHARAALLSLPGARILIDDDEA